MIKRLLRLVGRWARKPVNHTSWVAVVTPTDRPKSVRNRCLIELFCGVVCVVTLPFWHFCWCRGFCHRTESDLFLFLLIKDFFHRQFPSVSQWQCIFFCKPGRILKWRNLANIFLFSEVWNVFILVLCGYDISIECLSTSNIISYSYAY